MQRLEVQSPQETLDIREVCVPRKNRVYRKRVKRERVTIVIFMLNWCQKSLMQSLSSVSHSLVSMEKV